MSTVKKYQKDDLTVVWKPDLCIHSENCFKGLPGVFNPKARPWINVDGAEQVAIVDQVKACPSGALSFLIRGKESQDEKNRDTGSGSRVDVSINGPLLFKGTITICFPDGQSEIKTNPALCRCGHSGNKPYCDGSHKKRNFEG